MYLLFLFILTVVCYVLFFRLSLSYFFFFFFFLMIRPPPRPPLFPYTTLFRSHEPQRRWDESIAALAQLARAHRVELIAIGNGTASRETDKLAGDLIKLHPELPLTKVVVSEDRKSTRLNSSHSQISYAVFCLKK